jgi:flagellar biosynthesis chaperone FliJ
MSLESQRELENTRAKLKRLEERYAAIQAQSAATGEEKVREWTLHSLKKLINQLKEEIARFEARGLAGKEK